MNYAEQFIPQHIREIPFFQTGYRALLRALEDSERSEADIPSVARFDSNENPFPVESDLFPGRSALNRYTHPQPPELLGLLARLFSLPEESIVICDGTDSGLGWIIRTFCEPKVDSVVVTPPVFSKYAHAAELGWLNVTRIPQKFDGARYTFPTEQVLRTVAEGATCKANVKLIFLASPNNPTGGVLSREGIERLLMNLAELSPKTILVLDEAYWGFHDEDYSSLLPSAYPNLIRTITLSKACGLAGLRLGVVSVHPELRPYLLGMSPYVPLAAPSVAIALDVLGGEKRARLFQRIAMLREERARLQTELAKLSWVTRVLESAANFVSVALDNPEDVLRHCVRHLVFPRDISGLMGEGYIRITVGLPEENSRLLAVLREYRF